MHNGKLTFRISIFVMEDCISCSTIMVKHYLLLYFLNDFHHLWKKKKHFPFLCLSQLFFLILFYSMIFK